MTDPKSLREMKKRLAELERLMKQQEIETEFYKKMIDIAQEEYGIDIKQFSPPPSDTPDPDESQ
jgi:transposase